MVESPPKQIGWVIESWTDPSSGYVYNNLFVTARHLETDHVRGGTSLALNVYSSKSNYLSGLTSGTSDMFSMHHLISGIIRVTPGEYYLYWSVPYEANKVAVMNGLETLKDPFEYLFDYLNATCKGPNAIRDPLAPESAYFAQHPKALFDLTQATRVYEPDPE